MRAVKGERDLFGANTVPSRGLVLLRARELEGGAWGNACLKTEDVKQRGTGPVRGRM